MILTLVGSLIKVLLYTSGLITVGLALHKTLKIGRGSQWLYTGAAIFITCVVLRLLHLNALLAGTFSGAFSAENFSWIWTPNANQSYVFLAAIVVIFVVRHVQESWLTRGFLSISVLLIALGFALSGHSQGLETPGIAPVLVGMHFLIAGFWLVAPISLWPRLSTSNASLLESTQNFSQLAVFFVPILFVSGGWLLWRISGGFTQVFSSTYGQILLLKLGAATVLLGIGAYNKTVVTRTLKSEPLQGRVLLKRSLGLEAGLLVIIISLIALVTTLFGPTQV